MNCMAKVQKMQDEMPTDVKEIAKKAIFLQKSTVYGYIFHIKSPKCRIILHNLRHPARHPTPEKVNAGNGFQKVCRMCRGFCKKIIGMYGKGTIHDHAGLPGSEKKQRGWPYLNGHQERNGKDLQRNVPDLQQKRKKSKKSEETSGHLAQTYPRFISNI